jgi:uncharacterized membrane protein YqaE (UPF0057 family)
MVAGCGADFWINVCLTILGYVASSLSKRLFANHIGNRYFPGHIHAFYVEYVYYERKEAAREGRFLNSRAPGVYSQNVQSGGQGYGTIVQP